MSEACYCDYDYTVVVLTDESRVAKKQHQCSECNCLLQKGETYRYEAWRSDDGFNQHKTCSRCEAIKAYVKAHVPCFCWCYDSLMEDAYNTVREYSYQVPGMGLEFGRLYVTAMRYAAASRAIQRSLTD